MAERRAGWPDRVGGYRPADLIFLDEFGANTKMGRTHGRAAPGERVVGRVPHGHYKALSTIAAMGGGGGIVTSETFDGGTTAARFVAFVRDKLVPVLRPGQALVLDNLSAHKDRRAAALVEAAGCAVVHLPPYSPDLNPIENAFAKVKGHLRKLGRRTVPELLTAITDALATVTAANANAYAANCGYAR